MVIICTLLLLYQFVVLAAIVVSWFPPGGEVLESIRGVLAAATEPVLAPLRRALPPVRLGAMALDLSPLIVLIGLALLRGIICR